MGLSQSADGSVGCIVFPTQARTPTEAERQVQGDMDLPSAEMQSDPPGQMRVAGDALNFNEIDTLSTTARVRPPVWRRAAWVSGKHFGPAGGARLTFVADLVVPNTFFGYSRTL